MLTGLLTLSLALVATGIVTYVAARIQKRPAPEACLLWIPAGGLFYAVSVWSWVTFFS